MKALIFAAGLGTRLRPLTLKDPKALLPFMGTPLLEIAFKKLVGVGINDIAINTHHLHRKIEEFSLKLDPKPYISFEPNLLGTGGGIRNLLGWLKGSDLLVYNADVVFSFDLVEFIKTAGGNQEIEASMLLIHPAESDKTRIKLSSENYVEEFAPKISDQRSDFSFSGIHLIKNRLIQDIAADEFSIIDTYKKTLKKGKLIKGHFAPGYWKDLGTPKDYWQAHVYFLSCSKIEQVKICPIVNYVIKQNSEYTLISNMTTQPNQQSRLKGNIFSFDTDTSKGEIFLKDCLLYNSKLEDYATLDQVIVYKNEYAPN